MNKLKLIALLLSFTVFGSCDSETGRGIVSIQQISKVWKIKEVAINGKKDGKTDYSSHRKIFYPNNKYVFSTSSSAEGGVWEFDDSDGELILDKGTDSEKHIKVLGLTEDTLKIKMADVQLSEEELIFTLVSFKNQELN